MSECEHSQIVSSQSDIPGTCWCADCQTFIPIPYPRQSLPSDCLCNGPRLTNEFADGCMMQSDIDDGRKTTRGWKVNYDEGYAAGDAAGYARAKAEMINKLTEFRPTYVEGGRVPEDAIEWRTHPRRTDAPSV